MPIVFLTHIMMMVVMMVGINYMTDLAKVCGIEFVNLTYYILLHTCLVL